MLHTIQLITEIFIIIGAIVSLILGIGIVWRVEEELDISYKFLVASIFAFTASELIQVFNIGNTLLVFVVSMVFKLLFVLLLLASIFTMRDIIRKVDGEKRIIK